MKLDKVHAPRLRSKRKNIDRSGTIGQQRHHRARRVSVITTGVLKSLGDKVGRHSYGLSALG